VKPPRRRFLYLATCTAALPVVSCIARAQTYPMQQVRIIVGFAPGGPTDVMARLLAASMSERLGQPFIVENRPGADGNIATEAVVRSPADGYTLLLVNSSNAINATLYDKLNFDFIRDIAPVASFCLESSVMVVGQSVVASVPALITFAKSNPGQLSMASGGIGTGSHLAFELFKMLTGVNLTHVPYRGLGPALVDLLAGKVQILFAPLSAALPHIRSAKLRALAVTTDTRSEALPDVPTVNEFLPGYEASQWYGAGVPKATPTEIIRKLNQEVNTALADPRLKMRLAELGVTVLSSSPAQFGTRITDETEKWGRVIRFANIKAR
jgi:tripartite-type tricarboxylate transporter receptor subunit TctC